MAGLHLDPWQAWIMEEAHRVRSDRPFHNPYTGRTEYKWAAFEVGVCVSRQNGKGSILEARELAGLFLFGERLIIHSAHQFDTSLEAFERILTLIDQTPRLKKEIKRGGVSHSHGKEGIELVNGQRLRFRTRTKGGGRGFTADTLILDEAMYLDATMMAAILPTLSARPNPQVWYTGSAGTEESTQFGAVRERALKPPNPRNRKLFYCEWSIKGCNAFCQTGPSGEFVCEEHDDPASPQSWAKANPGMGIRISDEYVEDEMATMPEEEFMVERLGVGRWPVDGAQWKIIDEDHWKKQLDPGKTLKSRAVIAVDTSPDSKFSCIAAAGYCDDAWTEVLGEITKIEDMYDHRPGTQWVVPRIKAIWAANKPYAVVIDKASQAGQFVTELEEAGIKVISPNTREFAQSCGDLKSSVMPRKGEVADFYHLGQPPLTGAVSGADRRELTDLWAWSKALSQVDITPLVAVTLARWGLKQEANKPRTIPMVVFA